MTRKDRRSVGWLSFLSAGVLLFASGSLTMGGNERAGRERPQPIKHDDIHVRQADERGMAAILGRFGSVPPNRWVEVHTLDTDEFVITQARADGSFEVHAFAPAGAALQIHHRLRRPPLPELDPDPSSSPAIILELAPTPAVVSHASDHRLVVKEAHDPLFVRDETPAEPLRPKLVNFQLKPKSPCIDKGGFLTRTTTGGRGSSVPVVDAGFFIDGNGIVPGDLIQLEGSASGLRIVKVDYDENVITVNGDVTWTENQGVSQSFTGAKPDIGACEYAHAPDDSILDDSPVADSRPGAQAEKLILGFERAELARTGDVAREEKSGRESWFYLLDQPKGFDFAARFEWPGATNRAWTWRCRPGEHTEGELALVASIGPSNPRGRQATYRQTEFLSRFYLDTRERFEAHRLMTTFQWLTRADPALRDWSGYERLWVDVFCDAPAELSLALEDDLIEPPVTRTYKIRENRWVTLEVDLGEAARVRGLELAKIANFWLLGRASARGELRVDNVRIVRRGMPEPEHLLKDRMPMTVPLIPSGRPKVSRLPRELKPDHRPIPLGEPVVVARGSVVPFGWVSAYDNRFLFVAYTAKDRSKAAAAKAVYTDDGGQSWKPLPDPAARNLDHGTARGCAIDANGDGVAISSGLGCAGLGQANPRQHLTKYTFTGTGFRAESPTILDSDIRHCGSNASVVRLQGGPHRGRLWASWGQIGRAHRIGVHAKYSDDDGRTWIPWGKGALLPGSEASDWSDGTYGYPETVITPYRNHVACFWRHKRRCGVLWSVFDGAGWTPPHEVSLITLDGMDGAYRATMSAVTKGETEVFFTATGIDTVLRCDGKSWSTAPVQCEDGGMLSLAGDVVTLFNAGKVNRRWKGLDWSRQSVLRYYRRSVDGRWEGPHDLIPDLNIHEYRSMAGYCVPPYAPANYVPLVWSDFDEGTIKLLKVPMN